MYDGAGLNLQETTDIILFHDLSIEREQQVLGRALRLGRKNPLVVHRLKIKE